MNTLVHDKLLNINHFIIKPIIEWLIFLSLYFIFKSNSLLDHYSAYFPLIGETSFDALASILAFRLKN
ncbi:Uncharacterised protein [Legionella busanensis]|uniref:Uncharacterized protein n=1 Tax=Legionella busanensis TaxID=190655 RepID=A0A378JI85_9GAMM|nr:Uncharacterised protein [Legionella busanensis]